jgi:transcription elongation factor Elf1
MSPDVPGTTYVSPEVARLALDRHARCPKCGHNRSHQHSLDQGELDEIAALERGERTW